MAKCAECGAIRELYTIAQKDRTRLAQALAETALELQVEREPMSGWTPVRVAGQCPRRRRCRAGSYVGSFVSRP